MPVHIISWAVTHRGSLSGQVITSGLFPPWPPTHSFTHYPYLILPFLTHLSLSSFSIPFSSSFNLTFISAYLSITCPSLHSFRFQTLSSFNLIHQLLLFLGARLETGVKWPICPSWWNGWSDYWWGGLFKPCLIVWLFFFLIYFAILLLTGMMAKTTRISLQSQNVTVHYKLMLCSQNIFFSNSQKFISDSNGDHKVSRDIKYFRLMLWEMRWFSRNSGFQYSLSVNSFNQELEQTDKCDILSVWDCNFTTINLLWKWKLKET